MPLDPLHKAIFESLLPKIKQEQSYSKQSQDRIHNAP
jgi:hypothetical protein